MRARNHASNNNQVEPGFVYREKTATAARVCTLPRRLGQSINQATTIRDPMKMIFYVAVTEILGYCSLAD